MAKKKAKMSDRKRRLINRKISLKAQYRANDKLRAKLNSKDLNVSEKKKLTNQYLNKNVELNTELDELNKKLNRVSKKKTIKKIYQPNEENEIIETDYNAWHKSDFEDEIFEDGNILEVNGLKKFKDSDKIIDLINEISLEMTSKDVFKYEINFDTGEIIIFKDE